MKSDGNDDFMSDHQCDRTAFMNNFHEQKDDSSNIHYNETQTKPKAAYKTNPGRMRAN